MERKWLRELRIAKELTLQEVAKEIGVSWQSLSYYESGDRRPSPEVAQRIGKYLGFDWTKFYGRTDGEANGS